MFQLDAGHWITIIFAMVSAAFSIGVALAKLELLKEKLKALEESRDKQGVRIGDLETDSKVKVATERIRRETLQEYGSKDERK